jgi:hypothetical protein
LELQWMRMMMNVLWIPMLWNSLVQDKQERNKKNEIWTNREMASSSSSSSSSSNSLQVEVTFI